MAAGKSASAAAEKAEKEAVFARFRPYCALLASGNQSREALDKLEALVKEAK